MSEKGMQPLHPLFLIVKIHIYDTPDQILLIAFFNSLISKWVYTYGKRISSSWQ